MAQSRTEIVRFFALCVAFGAVIGGLAQTTRTTWNTSANTCSWSQEDTDDWIGSIMAGSIIGWIFALILSILGCIPLCCSGPTLKAQATIIGIVCILGGLFAFFIPAIAGAAATSGAIDDYCDRCQAEGYSSCSEADRDEAKDDIAALGIIVAYLLGFGWLVVIQAIVAMVLGCAIMCKCCKMKEEAQQPNYGPGNMPPQTYGQPQAAVIVGQPVQGGAAAKE